MRRFLLSSFNKRVTIFDKISLLSKAGLTAVRESLTLETLSMKDLNFNRSYSTASTGSTLLVLFERILFRTKQKSLSLFNLNAISAASMQSSALINVDSFCSSCNLYSIFSLSSTSFSAEQSSQSFKVESPPPVSRQRSPSDTSRPHIFSSCI